ncbi:MAG TPA: glycosyltransferase family 39 protein [Pyrinomonadaceae bacterium]|nr:glycosyltransferase family 39 protein [Pyrinomonadaceae bacterium]
MHKTLSAKSIQDLGLLFFLSLTIRSLWLKFGAWMQYDSAEYLLLARNLVTHGAFSLADNAETLTAHRPPLFPAMIAVLWRGDEAPVTAVLIANVALGSVTVCLTYLIARDRFDRRIALVAAAMLAFGPMTCLFTVTVLTETLFTFLVALAIFLWGRGLFAGAGTAFGLSALTRPSIFPYLAALPLLAIFPSFRRFWRGYLIILAAVLVVASGWIIRNATVFDRFILVASSGWGTNLLCGTLETDTGGRVWNGDAWAPLDLKTNPVTQVEGITDETEIDRVRMKTAISRIAEAPVNWMVVRAKQYPKLFIDNGDYLLGAGNLPLREAFRAGRADVIFVKVLFLGANLAVLMLAVYGIFTLRARLADHAHIVLFPVFGMLIHLPAWIEPRYFLPMMPMMFILAAVGMERLSILRRLFPEPSERA